MVTTISNLGYSRCGSRRGFRVHPVKRLSVKKLRVRFACWLQLLSRWRRAYGMALRAIKRGICRDKNDNGVAASAVVRKRDSSRLSSSSRRSLVREVNYVRSNSFYTEAIKDCLEFIKRNSVSVSAEQSQQFLELEVDDHRVWSPPEYDREYGNNKDQLLLSA